MFSNYFKYPKMLVTLDKDTVSFIRFIIILQAKELNKGRIKYHMYCMRQTFKYKSWGFSLSAIHLQFVNAKLFRCGDTKFI